MRCIGILIVGSVVAAPTGCVQSTNIAVHTPSTGSPEAHVTLSAKTAHFTSGDGGSVRLVARFPLPGARSGKPFCTLYFQLPADRGLFTIGQGNDQARGFLIQHFGSMAGWLRLTKGSVTLQGVPFGGSRLREGHVLVKGSDGTTVEGSLSLERSARALALFEREFAPDVTRLNTESQR